MATSYQAARKQNNDSKRVVFFMPTEELNAVNAWGIPAGMPSLSEAIRTLIRKGLEVVSDEKS